MKKLIYLFIMSVMLFGALFADTYTENFDTDGNWAGGTMGSYNAKTYTNSAAPSGDVFSSNSSVREATDTNSGAYAWRVNTGANYFRYSCSATVSGFSLYMARWDNNPAPSITIRYSTNSGSTYTDIETITGSWFTGDKVYRQYSYTFSTPISPDASSDIYIELNKTTGERLLVDDFVLTYTTSALPTISVNPSSLDGLTYVFQNGPSAEQSFTVTGSNLTANVSVSVTSNYQIASSAGGTWGTSLSYTPSSGSVSATVYVRQIAGLAIGTGYTGTVTCSSTGATDATVSLSGSVTSPPPPDAPEATAATNVANTSFTANWNAVSGATGYKIDVYTQVQTPTTLNEGFNGGTTAPTGWTFTNIGGTYTTSGNFGLASPSLQMDATNDAVETPTVSNPSSLSFWIKGNGTDASSALLVQGYDGTNWSTIDNISNLPTTGTTKTYSSLSSSLTNFKFTYTKSVGNLAFDDVSISYTASSISYISGYQDYDAGTATSLNITGLTPGTTYYYVVRAYNAYDTSGDSNEIEVTTTNTTPTITVSTTTLSGFGYMEGSGPSSEQSFTISGANLTANISIDAPTNYEISKGTGAAFNANMSDPLVLTQSGGTVGTTTIYVRLKAGLAAGDYNGEVITASSTGADNKIGRAHV